MRVHRTHRGVLDHGSGQYPDNVVAAARLTGTR